MEYLGNITIENSANWSRKQQQQKDAWDTTKQSQNNCLNVVGNLELALMRSQARARSQRICEIFICEKFRIAKG